MNEREKIRAKYRLAQSHISSLRLALTTIVRYQSVYRRERITSNYSRGFLDGLSLASDTANAVLRLDAGDLGEFQNYLSTNAGVSTLRGQSNSSGQCNDTWHITSERGPQCPACFGEEKSDGTTV